MAAIKTPTWKGPNLRAATPFTWTAMQHGEVSGRSKSVTTRRTETFAGVSNISTYQDTLIFYLKPLLGSGRFALACEKRSEPHRTAARSAAAAHRPLGWRDGDNDPVAPTR